MSILANLVPASAAKVSKHSNAEEEIPMAEYEVFVDDNFHYMQQDYRYSAGKFDTYE